MKKFPSAPSSICVVTCGAPLRFGDESVFPFFRSSSLRRSGRRPVDPLRAGGRDESGELVLELWQDEGDAFGRRKNGLKMGNSDASTLARHGAVSRCVRLDDLRSG